MDNELATIDSGECAMAEFDVVDGGQDSIITGIVDALSTASDVDPLELEPLQKHVDVDALQRLLSSQAARGAHAGDLTVSLSIEEYDVTIQSYGFIYVTERSKDR